MPTGIEWLVDATGCRPEALRDRHRLDGLFRRLVADLGLHPVGEPTWHCFPETHGLTGVWVLQESHLACHTFPEYGGLCVNLFCCVPRPAWDWERNLPPLLGEETEVTVRACERAYATAAARAAGPS
ncbi:MAG: S-adenosylmethionine decarboxylase [Planctomycetes bacterium]|nr:S-adenosylmethionine decarboxylase [Planctomycetota bacterium]